MLFVVVFACSVLVVVFGRCCVYRCCCVALFVCFACECGFGFIWLQLVAVLVCLRFVFRGIGGLTACAASGVWI